MQEEMPLIVLDIAEWICFPQNKNAKYLTDTYRKGLSKRLFKVCLHDVMSVSNG